MFCLCAICVGVCRSGAASFPSWLHPHVVFVDFVRHVAAFDASLLVDLIVSPETRFLLFMTKYLKLVVRDWTSFCEACKQCESSARKSQGQNCHAERGSVKIRTEHGSASVDMSQCAVTSSSLPPSCIQQRLVDYSSDESSCDDDSAVKSPAQQLAQTPASDTRLLGDVMTCLYRTSVTLDKVNATRQLVAFDLRPLIRLFERCEEIHEVMEEQVTQVTLSSLKFVQ